MNDPTEPIRRQMVAEINAAKSPRKALKDVYGKVWDTEEMTRDFEVSGFLAPFVSVTRKSDRVKGYMTFQHYPRFYWGFEPEA